MSDIANFVSEHSSTILIGAGVGIVAAKVLHTIERVSRLVLTAITLAVVGGGGAGVGAHILNSLPTLK